MVGVGVVCLWPGIHLVPGFPLTPYLIFLLLFIHYRFRSKWLWKGPRLAHICEAFIMSTEDDFSDQSVTPYLILPLLHPAVLNTFLSLLSPSCIYMHSLKLAFLVTF